MNTKYFTVKKKQKIKRGETMENVKEVYNYLMNIKEKLERSGIELEFEGKELLKYLINFGINSIEEYINESLDDCEEVPYLIDLLNKEFALIVRYGDNYYEMTIDLKNLEIKHIELNEDENTLDLYDFIVISGIYLKYLYNPHNLKELLLDTVREMFD